MCTAVQRMALVAVLRMNECPVVYLMIASLSTELVRVWPIMGDFSVIDATERVLNVICR